MVGGGRVALFDIQIFRRFFLCQSIIVSVVETTLAVKAVFYQALAAIPKQENISYLKALKLLNIFVHIVAITTQVYRV